MTSTLLKPYSSPSYSNINRRSFRVSAHQVVLEPHHPQKPNQAIGLAKTFSDLVQYLETPFSAALQYMDLLQKQKENEISRTPPKEEINGSTGFENLLNPLSPWFRCEIIKYGEFAQATYDAFDFDFAEYCGSCRYNRHIFFDELGLDHTGYKVSSYIYAMSQVDIPRWFQQSPLADTWIQESYWMGYVAVSNDEETGKIGRRDIVVAWRGTVAPSEWYEDLQKELEPFGDGEVKVEQGFLRIYTSKSESTKYNKSSASEQVMKEINRLVSLYRQRGEEVTLTITGHSLGGAVGLLNAYEAAEAIPDLPIRVFSFGAPRAGNIAFRDKINQMGVKTLRVVVKQDVIPRMLGIVFNEGLQKFEEIVGHLDWVYTHVGNELWLDVGSSPYLKKGLNLFGYHSLETYLHLVDGYVKADLPFREDAQRDLALVNKACGMLVDKLRIQEGWYKNGKTGLVRNSSGRWVDQSRDSESYDYYVNHTL